MKPTLENISQTPANPLIVSIKLTVETGEHIPSFKNTKRAILDDKTGHMRTLTPGEIKRRMSRLETAIESALYFWCQTEESGTASEWLKRLRTALSGLSDDSLDIIPEFSYGVRRVQKGFEGVEITIERYE